MNLLGTNFCVGIDRCLVYTGYIKKDFLNSNFIIQDSGLFMVSVLQVSLYSKLSKKKFSVPPRLPLDKPDMTEDDQSTVSLRWRPALVPDRARDKYPVTYSIEVKNPPNLEWRDIETGLTGLSHTLKNIHPEFDYMFRIRAHNEFGSSEATLPVSLYRPIGKDFL